MGPEALKRPGFVRPRRATTERRGKVACEVELPPTVSALRMTGRRKREGYKDLGPSQSCDGDDSVAS